jgi:hypothetical protein
MILNQTTNTEPFVGRALRLPTRQAVRLPYNNKIYP